MAERNDEDKPRKEVRKVAATNEDDDDNIVLETKFRCPKPVMVLCLAYGVVLGLHYSLIVAKPLYVNEDLKMGRTMGIFLSHFPVGIRLLGGIIAAVLADSYFGKYNVMATSYCLVFLIPGPLTIISTFHSFDLNTRVTVYLVAVVTELLVGFGSVVHPAFIAEQFKMPQQQITLQTYYMFDYFYYNVCIAVLEFVTLEYTNEVSCLGGQKCYQIVFIGHFISYGIATVLFVIMKRWYIIRMPERSVMSDAIKCICSALKNKRKDRGNANVQHEHWLDWADCFDQQWRDDLKRIGRLMTMLFPYFVYYILYAQMNSMWIFQACRLNGHLSDSWTMKPSQVESLNPIVIICVAPILEFVVNPFLERHKFLTTPLQRIGLAYFLTVFAFIMAAVLQIYIDKYSSPLFSPNKAQFRVFNCINETVELKSKWLSGKVRGYEVQQALDIDADDVITTEMEVIYSNSTSWTGTVKAKEDKGTNYLIKPQGLIKLNQELDNTWLMSLRPSVLIICADSCKGTFYIKYSHFVTEKYQLEDIDYFAFTVTLQCTGPWRFYINDKFVLKHSIDDGGLYAVIIYRKTYKEQDIQISTLIKPNALSIVWIFPQYITITISEIFLYVATNMFVYTQSPPSMRSVVRGMFTAGNSLAQISLGLAALIRVPEMIWFFSLSGLLLLAAIVHVVMAKKYIYQKPHD